MKLNDQQKEGIKALYGANTTGAETAINTIEKKKGAFRFFNEDGTVNISIAELEKKLNKAPKNPKAPKGNKHIGNGTTIFATLKNLRDDVKSLKNLSDYNDIVLTFKSVYEDLKKKKAELKQAEIDRITSEIEELTTRKNSLLAEKEK